MTGEWGQPPPLAIVGPTASGKSALAMAVARAGNGFELVSVDSMQVYRGMDIGTAKPSPTEQSEVPHHLIDIADPAEDYTVARFQHDARAVLAGVGARSGRALLVGGTGLYLQAVVDRLTIPGQYPEVRSQLEAEADTAALHARLARLDPAAAARMEPTNRRRVLRALEVTEGSGRPFSSFGPGLDRYPATPVVIIGVRLPRDVVDRRIADRYRHQLRHGFVDEVRRLLDRPAGLSRTARQALGYRELIDHLQGRCSQEEAVEVAIARTRRFARRQERWFRRDPRIRWLAPDDPSRASDLAERVLDMLRSSGG